MQEEKQKPVSVSANNSHGIWVCNKCGWTSLKPHPSAKQRRNHKKHCRKIGDSKESGSRNWSSPDSDEDGGSPVESDTCTIKSNDSQETCSGKSLGPVGDGRKQTGFEEFAATVTEFSEVSPSAMREWVQVGESDSPDREDKSAYRSLAHNRHVSVAVETDLSTNIGDSHMETKPSIEFDSFEVSGPKSSSSESLQANKHETFAVLMGKPVHGHMHSTVGLRKDGLACILEQDPSRRKGFSSDRDDVSVGSSKKNDESHLIQQPNDQSLEPGADLVERKIQPSKHSISLPADLPEDKESANLLLSLSGAAGLHTMILVDGFPSDAMNQIVENEKGHTEMEIDVNADHKYQRRTDTDGINIRCNKEKHVLPYKLEGSPKLEVPLKDSTEHLEASASESYAYAEMQAVSPVKHIHPHELPLGSMSGFEMVKSGDLDGPAVGHVKAMKVPFKSQIGNLQFKSCEDEGSIICDHQRDEHDEVPTNINPASNPLPNIDGISSDVDEDPASVKQVTSSLPAIAEESTGTCDGGSILTPMPPKTFSETTSYVDEDLNLAKQEVSFCFPGLNVSTDTDNYPEVAVFYSDETQNAGHYPAEKVQGMTCEQENKIAQGVDKRHGESDTILSAAHGPTHNMHALVILTDNVVTGHNESIFGQNNSDEVERENLPPLTTSSESKCGNGVSELVDSDSASHFSGSDSCSCVTPESSTSTLTKGHQDVPVDQPKAENNVFTRNSYSLGGGAFASIVDSEVHVEIAQGDFVKEEIGHDSPRVWVTGDSTIRTGDERFDLNEEESSDGYLSTVPEFPDESSDMHNPVTCIYANIDTEQGEVSPTADDNKVTYVIDYTIAGGGINFGNLNQKTVANKEQCDQSLDVQGTQKDHTNVSSIGDAPLEKDEDDLLIMGSHIEENCCHELTSSLVYQDNSHTDIEVHFTESHVYDNKSSTLPSFEKSHISNSLGSLEDSNVKGKQESIESGSSVNLEIISVEGRNKLSASGSGLETSTAGVVETPSSIAKLDGTEDEGFSTGDSAALPTGEGIDGKEKATCNDNLKVDAVEACRNEDGANIFEPPPFMTLAEMGRDEYTEDTNSTKMTPENDAKIHASVITETVWFPSVSPVANDSQGKKKNEEIVVEELNSRKTHTRLRNLLVESMEEDMHLEYPKEISKDDVKLVDENVGTRDAGKKGDPLTRNAGKKAMSSFVRTLSSKREKRKNKGMFSWVTYTCCSPID